MRAESAQVLSDLGAASHVAKAIGLRASYAEPKQANLSLRLVAVPQMPHTSPAQASEAPTMTNDWYPGQIKLEP